MARGTGRQCGSVCWLVSDGFRWRDSNALVHMSLKCSESVSRVTVPRNHKALWGCSNCLNFTNKCGLDNQETCARLVRDLMAQ